MDKVGIAIFAVISYSLTFAIAWWAFAADFVTYENIPTTGMIVYLALSAIPPIAALVATRISSSPSPPMPKFWPIPLGPAVAIVFIVAVISMGGAVIQGLVGAANPDWSMHEILKTMPSSEELDLEEEIPASFLLGAGAVITLVLSLVFYPPFALPTEYAWRGFLMTRFSSLGRLPSYLIAGVLWGLWFAPAATSKYLTETPASTLLRVILLAIALTIILGEIARRTDSLILCAVFTGSFLSQANMLAYIFPMPNAPWGGRIGFVNVGIWMLLALVLFAWPHKEKSNEAATPKPLEETA